MKPGDLVTVAPEVKADLFPVWAGSSRVYPKPCGVLRPGEVATVLEDTAAQGGNGTRVLASSGLTGWTYRAYLVPLETSP